jgi:hypothetical protein
VSSRIKFTVQRTLLALLTGLMIMLTPGCFNFGPPLSEVVIGHWYCAEIDEHMYFSTDGTITTHTSTKSPTTSGYSVESEDSNTLYIRRMAFLRMMLTFNEDRSSMYLTLTDAPLKSITYTRVNNLQKPLTF